MDHWLAVLKSSELQTSEKRSGDLKFRSSYFSNFTRLYDRGESVFLFEYGKYSVNIFSILQLI
jgi:hypothetical protein